MSCQCQTLETPISSGSFVLLVTSESARVAIGGFERWRERLFQMAKCRPKNKKNHKVSSSRLFPTINYFGQPHFRSRKSE